MTEQTPEQEFASSMHSVDAIGALAAKAEKTADDLSAIERNAKHLQIVISRGVLDTTQTAALQAAIDLASTYVSLSVSYGAPVPAPRHITQLAFMTRFTDAEAIALDLASIGATVEAATIRRYLDKVKAAKYIDLDRPDTRAGVQALETVGLIGTGRALEILDNPVVSTERA